mmetsp:Transcript_17305/g.21581  ORF Transcript_17305/g.21581 Transcript_17305/m.21581 type:complete len:117 (+) Transcript_17305:1560-1910(+)
MWRRFGDNRVAVVCVFDGWIILRWFSGDVKVCDGAGRTKRMKIAVITGRSDDHACEIPLLFSTRSKEERVLERLRAAISRIMMLSSQSFSMHCYLVPAYAISDGGVSTSFFLPLWR